MRLATFFFAFVLSAFAGAAQAQVVTLNKGGFVLTYDCSIHSATRYEYTRRHRFGRAPVQLLQGSGPAGRLPRPDQHRFLRQHQVWL